MQTVEIRDRTALPMREISALAVRSNASHGTELMAVGDEDYAVVRAEVTSSEGIMRTWRDDLCAVLTKAGVDTTSGSGFEGVACDGDGNVLVLQEEASLLYAFSPDLGELLGTVSLFVPPDTPGYGRQWHADPNSRAEGLLLLSKGHVLCAKQKDPVRLIEFGPADHGPLGVA